MPMLSRPVLSRVDEASRRWTHIEAEFSVALRCVARTLKHVKREKRFKKLMFYFRIARRQVPVRQGG